ncbi:MAG: hypothetical protein HYX69_08110 [Planctomycetia bacterium]|nr:hypothetical protein [Planctomycetia bacterium]
METSLHRELKALYADDDARVEVRVGRYRVDAVAGGELVEIQHGRLGAIAVKIRDLLAGHRVRIVKPIVCEKLLVKRRRSGGRIVSHRRSPKRGRVLDLFHELVYFTKVFPHPRLTVEALLVDIEEHRFAGHGRRRRWRRDDHQVEDQRLVRVRESHVVRTPSDLVALLACELAAPFHSGDLADRLDVPRFLAQRIAYCLREAGAAKPVGKRGNAVLYELVAAARRIDRSAA